MVGPLADSLHVLEGNYNGTPSRATTALDGIRKQFAGAQVTFTPGASFLLEYGASAGTDALHARRAAGTEG